MKKRWLIGGAAVLIACALPFVHLAFRPDREALARGLAAEQLSLWRDPERLRASLERMRRTNAEWDFMSRTFLVLAFANLALREEARAPEYLEAIDAILEATLALEARAGQEVFLMPYAKARPFVMQPPRSVFVDGEIALMLGARRLVAEDERWAARHRERVAVIVERMQESPSRSLESYPDEAWMFCNSTAVAAVRMADVLDGSDHSAAIAAWLAAARAKLIDPATGMFVSSFTLEGSHLDGPEGSSIFMVAHNLLVADRALARDQYARARRELGRTFLGFGWAREWPAASPGHHDVDSGMVVPVLEASAGASGLMILGAATFGDDAMLDALLTSLELAAGPEETATGRRYGATEGVGDTVILYALVQGPLWARLETP